MTDRHTYDEDDIVGTVGAAKVLGVSVDTVRRLASDGHLPHHWTGPTVGAHRRFVVRDLRAAQATWTPAPPRPRASADEPAVEAG